MIAALVQGFATGAALIIAIGSQNAFVLRQGLRREHVPHLVAFCALADALLIVCGISGAGALLRGNAELQAFTRYAGAAFLAGYGLLAARRSWRGGAARTEVQGAGSLAAALSACFAFTFLNPHVYLDTVVLMGAIAQQFGDHGRWWFCAGACLASLTWFSALGFGARLLAPWFAKALAWRVLDAIIAIVMLALSLSLLRN